MKRKILLLSILFIFLLGISACSSQPKTDLHSVSKDAELFTVANNVSLKKGTSIDGDTVLESADFIGFSYEYNESQKEYTFTFKLTGKGQKKMTVVSTKLAETAGALSLWIGDELITSPKIIAPITGDAFAMYIAEANEGNISEFVNKLESK